MTELSISNLTEISTASLLMFIRDELFRQHQEDAFYHEEIFEYYRLSGADCDWSPWSQKRAEALPVASSFPIHGNAFYNGYDKSANLYPNGYCWPQDDVKCWVCIVTFENRDDRLHRSRYNHPPNPRAKAKVVTQAINCVLYDKNFDLPPRLIGFGWSSSNYFRLCLVCVSTLPSIPLELRRPTYH
jgi:hypothetical protein